MTPPAQGSSLPNNQLNIISQHVYAKPRKLKATWTAEAVDDFVGPQRPTNVLDLLKDALEDPNYDPSDKGYKGRWRWSDGRLATPEEIKRWDLEGGLVASMAAEMRAEIDREITDSLGLLTSLMAPVPAAPIMDMSADQILPPLPRALEAAILSTPVEGWCKDAARLIYARNLHRPAR